MMMPTIQSAEATVARSYRWPASPYKGLSFYVKGDVPLFAGREDDVVRCASLLNLGATRIMMLHGATGCGKSSFLRAGLIPFLESRSTGFKFIKADEADEDSKALFVRSTANPLVSTAEAIYGFASNDFQLETPIGTHSINLFEVLKSYQSKTEFMEQAGKNPKLMVEILRQIATKLSRTLILIIDQAEEVLTLKTDREGDEPRRHFFEFMSLFSQSQFDLKLMVALRTEYFGKFYSEMHLDDALDTRNFYLRDFSREQLIRAIERPTLKEKVFDYGRPFDQYQFTYEEGLAGKIADDLISRNLTGGVLPVLQIVCDRLYLKTKPRSANDIPWVIKEEDYRSLRGIEEQLDDYIKQILVELCRKKSIPPSEIINETARWRDVICILAKMQIDGTVTTEVKPDTELAEAARQSKCKLDFQDTMDYLSGDETRILRHLKVISLKSTKAIDCYSLGHDAIGLVLLRWKVAKEERVASQIRAQQQVVFYGGLTALVSLFIAVAVYFSNSQRLTSAAIASLGVCVYSLALTLLGYLSRNRARYVAQPYWSLAFMVRWSPSFTRNLFIKDTIFREHLRQYPELSERFEKDLERVSAEGSGARN
jgi:hypothetical protein